MRAPYATVNGSGVDDAHTDGAAAASPAAGDAGAMQRAASDAAPATGEAAGAGGTGQAAAGVAGGSNGRQWRQQTPSAFAAPAVADANSNMGSQGGAAVRLPPTLDQLASSNLDARGNVHQIRRLLHCRHQYSRSPPGWASSHQSSRPVPRSPYPN